MKDSGKILFFDPADTIRPTEDKASPEWPAPSVNTDAEAVLTELLRLLAENGFNPSIQMAAYLIADDPTYLPEEGDARALARRIGRDKLLEALLAFYWEAHPITSDDRS